VDFAQLVKEFGRKGDVNDLDRVHRCLELARFDGQLGCVDHAA
jgi:hypothetical protein